MNEANIALLADRGVVAVNGDDAGKLLAGVITNDMDALDTQPALFAGLLTPQGKILFEFFVVKMPGGVLLDVARDKAADLVKRLGLYKLRAKVEITDKSATMAVVAGLGSTLGGRAVSYDDPRRPGLWPRAILLDAGASGGPGMIASNRGWRAAGDYHAHRIALGVPEGGKDWDFGDAYPHEANFDILNGVSFAKGCYVGQEVVARMQHKTVVRKRVVKVEGDRELPATRPDIKAGEAVIGRLGSVAGRQGLALLRLDRAIEAAAKGEPIVCDGATLIVDPAALDHYARSAGQHGGAA